mgnify:CR=1 FL=1
MQKEEEEPENMYSTADDGEEGDFDQGPDLDNIIDRMLTLTPDTHPPTADPGEAPPALPPKMSRKQNGVVPHTEEAKPQEGNGTGTPPEVPPRREKKDEGTVRIGHKC